MALLPLITATVVLALLAPHSQAKSVVCYFPNWTAYRQGSEHYGVENIDPKLCTQLIYSFSSLEATSLLMTPYDQWMDIDKGSYAKFNALRQQNPHLQTLLAIGGWSDSQIGDKYSRLVQDANNRARFIQDAIQFLKRYGFQGLDLDWEFPKDKAGFSAWVKELKTAFKPQGYFLSAAVSGGASAVDAGYDVAEVSQWLDQIHLMSYDFHGVWEKQADYHAALYPDVDNAVNYWISKGAPANKLVLGIPTYGISWTLTSSNVVPPCPASGAGAGKLQKGNMPYWEICQSIKSDGWTEVRDATLRKEAYAYKLPYWVSYDDPSIAQAKGSYAQSKGLGGIMFWELSADDFGGLCGQGKNPIMVAARKAYCGSEEGDC